MYRCLSFKDKKSKKEIEALTTIFHCFIELDRRTSTAKPKASFGTL